MSVQFKVFIGKFELDFPPQSPLLKELSQILPEGSYCPRADQIGPFTERTLHIIADLKNNFKSKDFFGLFSQLGNDLHQLVYDFPLQQENMKMEDVSTKVSLKFIDENTFGVFRKAALNWPLTGSFLATVCSYGAHDSHVIWETSPPSAEGNIALGAMWRNISGEPIELTRFHLMSMNEHPYNKIVSMRLQDDATREDNVPRVLNECDRLFKEILQTSDPDLVLRDIAALHWWLIQASPWVEGNAEAAAILTTALSDYKSLSIGDWNADVFVIAQTTPLEEFVKIYHTLRK